MRHVSYCMKDVYTGLYVFISHVGTFFLFYLYIVLWPMPSQTGGFWSCHTNGSNSRSKHKPDALAVLLKDCCDDKGLHTQLCLKLVTLPRSHFKDLVCVPFPLPVLIDGVNLRIRSPVQFVYSKQTPGGLTTDQTDHKPDRGETGRQRESHLVVIVKP